MRKHHCSKCGETNPDKFYGHKKANCAECHNIIVKEKGKANKVFGVNFLGGKCLHCGYSKCIEALEFHHTDPKIKDENFRCMRGWSEKRLILELEKCILLCSNCHREEHQKLFLLEVSK